MGHVHHAALLFIAVHVRTQLKAQVKVLELQILSSSIS